MVTLNVTNGIQLPLVNHNRLSVYCIFHYVIWLAFIPISVHGLWEWFMFLTLFAQVTYVNILHWIVKLYYYGFPVNEGICLIFVIHTFRQSALSVFYSKDVSPTSSIVWYTSLPLIILNAFLFTLLTLWFVYIRHTNSVRAY